MSESESELMPPRAEYWTAVQKAQEEAQQLEKKNEGPPNKKAPKTYQRQVEEVDRRTGEVVKRVVQDHPPMYFYVSAEQYLSEWRRVAKIAQLNLTQEGEVILGANDRATSLKVTYTCVHVPTGQGRRYRLDFPLGQGTAVGGAAEMAYTKSIRFFFRSFLNIPGHDPNEYADLHDAADQQASPPHDQPPPQQQQRFPQGQPGPREGGPRQGPQRDPRQGGQPPRQPGGGGGPQRGPQGSGRQGPGAPRQGQPQGGRPGHGPNGAQQRRPGVRQEQIYQAAEEILGENAVMDEEDAPVDQRLLEPPPEPNQAPLRGSRNSEPRSAEQWRLALIGLGWDEKTATDLVMHRPDEVIPDALRSEIGLRAVEWYGSTEAAKAAWEGTGFLPDTNLGNLRPKPNGIQLLRYLLKIDLKKKSATDQTAAAGATTNSN